jgi:hypothetical protein
LGVVGTARGFDSQSAASLRVFFASGGGLA